MDLEDAVHDLIDQIEDSELNDEEKDELTDDLKDLENDIEEFIEEVDDFETEVYNLPVGNDLSDYPTMFLTEGKFNGLFVVGESAAPIDVLSMIDVAVFFATLGYYEPSMGATKLDSEIASVPAQNLIVVGNPCVNTVAAELLGFPSDCTEGFEPGKAKIQLFQHANGNYALLIAGYSGEDTRLAAKVLANYPEKIASAGGMEVIIEGTTAEDATVTEEI